MADLNTSAAVAGGTPEDLCSGTEVLLPEGFWMARTDSGKFVVVANSVPDGASALAYDEEGNMVENWSPLLAATTPQEALRRFLY